MVLLLEDIPKDLPAHFMISFARSVRPSTDILEVSAPYIRQTIFKPLALRLRQQRLVLHKDKARRAASEYTADILLSSHPNKSII